jgi:hypothetical protein
LAFLAQKSPDLALIVKRWDNLPEPVRACIVAMVKWQVENNLPTEGIGGIRDGTVEFT